MELNSMDFYHKILISLSIMQLIKSMNLIE